MKLTTLEDFMNDRQAFEQAMQRVQSQNHREGRTGVTFRQMTKQANE